MLVPPMRRCTFSYRVRGRRAYTFRVADVRVLIFSPGLSSPGTGIHTCKTRLQVYDDHNCPFVSWFLGHNHPCHQPRTKAFLLMMKSMVLWYDYFRK
jgi:hypothetical protein